MSQLVSELVVGYKSMAGKGVTLMERIAPEVPKEVLVDPLRVKQILSNGLTNALKHTTEGGVLLQVSRRDCIMSFPYCNGGIVLPSTDQRAPTAPQCTSLRTQMELLDRRLRPHVPPTN